MTAEAFLDWAEARGEPFEYDGHRAVPMNGGLVNHYRIAFNLHRALHDRLAGTTVTVLGLGIGIETVGGAVRFPDAVLTSAPVAGKARLLSEPLIVFEVLSPTSQHTDRVEKTREYASVGSILRYVIIESDRVGVTAHARPSGDRPWTTPPDADLVLPEVGIVVPLAEVYVGTDLG